MLSLSAFMAFHADFWVAAATAAPVIGLAHTVNLGVQRRGLIDLVSREAANTVKYALAAAGIVRVPIDREAKVYPDSHRAELFDQVETDMSSSRSAIDGIQRSGPRTDLVAAGGVVATAAALTIALAALILERDLGAPTLWITATLVVLGMVSLLRQAWASRRFYYVQVVVMHATQGLDLLIAYTEIVEADRARQGAPPERDP
jgi:hypothetical protein